MEPWREELYSNELYHFGIKGMKWGKHKGGNKPYTAKDRYYYRWHRGRTYDWKSFDEGHKKSLEKSLYDMSKTKADIVSSRQKRNKPLGEKIKDSASSVKRKAKKTKDNAVNWIAEKTSGGKQTVTLPFGSKGKTTYEIKKKRKKGEKLYSYKTRKPKKQRISKDITIEDWG